MENWTCHVLIYYTWCSSTCVFCIFVTLRYICVLLFLMWLSCMGCDMWILTMVTATLGSIILSKSSSTSYPMTIVHVLGWLCMCSSCFCQVWLWLGHSSDEKKVCQWAPFPFILLLHCAPSPQLLKPNQGLDFHYMHNRLRSVNRIS